MLSHMYMLDSVKHKYHLLWFCYEYNTYLLKEIEENISK